MLRDQGFGPQNHVVAVAVTALAAAEGEPTASLWTPDVIADTLGGPAIWKEMMRSSHACGRTLAASLIAFGVGLAVVPTASADPNDAAQTDAAQTDAPPPPGPGGGPITSVAPTGGEGDPATSDACKQFAAAMSYTASHYEDFAYDSAGGGNVVNYDDPNVSWDNSAGRAALREAAGTAMQTSTTPGLPPDIADPMQAWSLQATKLVLVMGLRGGGDTLNSTATEMNTDAHNVQMACARAGVHAR